MLLPDDDFEMLLFLLPIADIPAVNADRDGAIGDGQCRPIGGTSLHKGPLLLAQFVFTALRDREGMVLHRRRVQRRIHREKVLQRLRRQAIGDQRGPLRLHEEQLGGDRVGQQGVQRPEGGGLAPLAATMIEAWTGEGHGAKQGAEGARVVPFDPERLATVVTLGMGRDKGRRLLFHQLLLERLEDGLRFGQREAQMLDPLVRLLHHRDLLDLLFTTILCTHDKLHLDLHGVSSRLGHTD